MKNLNVSRVSKSISKTFGKAGLATAAVGLSVLAMTIPQQSFAAGLYTYPLRVNEQGGDDGECTSIGEGMGTTFDWLTLGIVPSPTQALQALNAYMTLFASGDACKMTKHGSPTDYNADVLVAAGNLLVGGALFANGGLYVNREFVMTHSNMYVHYGNNIVKGVQEAAISPFQQQVSDKYWSGYEAINGSQLFKVKSVLDVATPSGSSAFFKNLSTRLIAVSDSLAELKFDPAAISSNLASVSSMAANFQQQSFTAAQSGNLSDQISTISAQVAAGSIGACDTCSYISNVLDPNLKKVSNQLVGISAQVGNVAAVSSYLTTVETLNSRVSSALNVILAGGVGTSGTLDPALYASVSNMMNNVGSSLNSQVTNTNNVSNAVSAWGSAANVTALTSSIGNASSTLTQINVNIDRLMQVAGGTTGGITSQPGVSGGGSTGGAAPAQSNGTNSLAIGFGSQANGTNSVAIGYGSVASGENEFSVGGNGMLRRITNVAEPTANTDAATKAYIDKKTKDYIASLANGGSTGSTTVVNIGAEAEKAVTRTAARGAASAGAMAQIPQVDTTRTVGIGAGWANAKGANGFAVGASARLQDMFVGKASYAFASGDKGKYVKKTGMWGVGGLVQW